MNRKQRNDQHCGTTTTVHVFPCNTIKYIPLISILCTLRYTTDIPIQTVPITFHGTDTDITPWNHPSSPCCRISSNSGSISMRCEARTVIVLETGGDIIRYYSFRVNSRGRFTSGIGSITGGLVRSIVGTSGILFL